MKTKVDNRDAKAKWVLEAVNKFEHPLILYAARLLGDEDRAKDVVQETFLKLCKQDQDRLKSHLAEWLYTVCRNRVFDIRRKEKRMQPLSEAQTETKPSHLPGPSQELEKKESTSEVINAMYQLPENQQEVIRLKFQNGLSYKEISKVTDLSVSNVGFLIHTGLKALRQRLNQVQPQT